MRRSGTAYPYLTMTTPALIREPRISSMAPAIGPDALPAPTTKIRWIERRSYRRAATRNTCPRRETWRFTAAAGSTARTAAVRIEAACRLRPGLGFPLKRVSWNTAAQSWRVEELESWRVPAVSCTFQLSNFSTFQPTRQGASLPQGAGPVGPHGLDPDCGNPLALECPLYRIARQRGEVVDVTEMDQKDRLRPVRCDLDDGAGGSVVGEVTGGTQDAVLEKPGIGADREQAQVVIGFQDEGVRVAGASEEVIGDPTQVGRDHHPSTIVRYDKTHRLYRVVWHRKCLNLHAADPERHAGHKTFRGNSREQISRSRQGTRVGQHRRVQQSGQGASAFGVVIVFVGQQDRSDRRGAGDAVQFARHHLRGQSHVDDEARPRRFEENGVAAAPTTQDAKAHGMIRGHNEEASLPCLPSLPSLLALGIPGCPAPLFKTGETGKTK